MRIGILTFHCAHNYGAMLQCYALQEYLKGRGDEVYVIDYRPDYLTHPYKKHKLSHWLSKDPLRTLKRLLSEPFLLKKRGKRWDGFDNFMRMKLNLYPYDMSSDYSNFDWLLFGSDQIWSSRLTGGRFDPVFFGQGVNCRKATYAASMSPAYSKRGADKHDFIDACREKCYAIYEQIPELPFSNIWTAMQLSSRLPEKSLLHISASNTRRCWNIFPLPETVESSCNVGCCGIDGCTSTLIGASLVNPKRLCYLVTGDLAFFYDINVLGNRHVGNNVRILLINNGVGTEFKMNSHNSYMAFKEDVNEYMAAEGHFGRKSPCLVKHFAEDLGFEYLTASTKNEFMQALDKFTNPSLSDKPIIFEVFTDAELEREALEIMTTLDYDAKTLATHKLKETAKSVLGKNLINTIRKFSK